MEGKTEKMLFEKLGIRSGDRLLILNPPEHYPYLLGPLPQGVEYAKDLSRPLDFIQYFIRTREDLAQAFPGLKSILAKDGKLWISWPKLSSHVDTDLTENIIREIGSSNGLVDVKVVSIDDTWSSLKFMYRKEDRS